ncbi:MAG: class I tRNA ligase family protein [Spirochaetaceae bacterium]|jgi:methionyl-tRNA synthetase|nr:class I tRNA ligase family protein [Spirochaetaceae bacterium]
MLKALELPPPKGCLVHGYWIGIDGKKMAKSLGNAVDPTQLISLYGADTLRFFLARNMGRNEAKIGEELVQHCYVSILSNNIGNAYLRAVKMVERYCQWKIPQNTLSYMQL